MRPVVTQLNCCWAGAFRAPALLALALAGIAATWHGAKADEVVVGAVATPASLHQPDGGSVRSALEAAFVAAARPGRDGIGRLDGKPARLVVVEDDCTRTSGEEAARRLVAEKASVVIGHVCAGAALAAATVYAAAGVPLIVPGVRHPRLTSPRAGPLVFRLAGRSNRLAREIGAIAMTRSPGGRLALLHDRSAEARGFADAVEKALLPVRPALRLDFPSGEKSYQDVAGRLTRAEADVIVMPAQPVELGLILDALATRGPARAHVVAGEHMAAPDLDAVAGRHGSRITLMLPWPGASPGSGHGPVHRQATAAFEAWHDAVRRAGSTEAQAVARALVESAAPTALGPLKFDTAGDAEVPSYVPHAWNGGRWVPM